MFSDENVFEVKRQTAVPFARQPFTGVVINGKKCHSCYGFVPH
jgi:hypothetical protein